MSLTVVHGREVDLRLSMLDQVGHAVIATDLTGLILYWNDAARDLYGFDAREVVGQQIYYVLPAALADAEIDAMMAGFAAGKPWDGILRVRRKDGEWIRTLHSDRVILDEQGAPAVIVSASFAASRAEQAVTDEKEDFVAKDLVVALIGSMRHAGEENARRMRETGRAFAKRANCPGTTVYLELFSKMGMGDLKLDHEQGTRLVFSGTDLIERMPHSHRPTCHLPLGFLEGAIAALTGRVALGTEIQCQSMGAKRCVFIVSAK